MFHMIKSLPSPGGGPTYFRRLVNDQASLKRFRQSVCMVGLLPYISGCHTRLT